MKAETVAKCVRQITSDVVREILWSESSDANHGEKYFRALGAFEAGDAIASRIAHAIWEEENMNDD